MDWAHQDDDDEEPEALAAEPQPQTAEVEPQPQALAVAPQAAGVLLPLLDVEPTKGLYIHEEAGMSLPTDIKEDVLASIRDSDTPPLSVRPGYMISLCSSCFQRGYQLRAAMGPNLAHLQCHRPYARWVMLLCKDEREEPGVAAEPQPLRRWVAPPSVDVERKHMLVNLD